MHTIHLEAVDSRQATADELDAAQITPDQVPPDKRIMAHQAATIRALRFGTAPIVINSAITGDGKSLAGQFRLFADGTPTLIMYPTNELSRDQKRSLDALLSEWTPPRWTRSRPSLSTLNASELDTWQDALEHLGRPEVLKTQLDNDLILTNPDIFHLMMQFGYQRRGAAHDFLLGEVLNRFSLFIFDEFHQFGAAQTGSVLIAMLLALKIGEVKNPPRFLFMSATPQAQLLHLARLAGVEVERIKGEYIHGCNVAEDGYRRILQPVDLHLYSGKLETWVTENLETVILPFFKRNRPGARGVIIANSVATAYRIYALIKARTANIKVALNTGLTPPEDRLISAELLVATSTVDVGVDFRVNLIIFESIDAASHIQRLGRLGRHEKDEHGNVFPEFEAHALLPPWVVEALATKFPTGITTDREKYADTVQCEEVYPPLQHFDAYLKRWSGVQAAHVLGNLSRTEIKRQYDAIYAPLAVQYKALFPSGRPIYYRLSADEQIKVLKEAISFRGGSPFMALVVDKLNGSQSVVPYNLIALLLNCELKSVPLDDLYDRAQRQGKSVKALKRAQPIAGYELQGWLPQSRPLDFYVDRELDVTRFDVVIEQTGFRLSAPGVPEMTALNDQLEQQTLVALLLCNEEPEAIRRRLRLGFQIDLFKFHSADGSTGSVAFARDALLLDSVLFRFRKSNDNRPIIC